MKLLLSETQYVHCVLQNACFSSSAVNGNLLDFSSKLRGASGIQ
jgi:hypothetical protein